MNKAVFILTGGMCLLFITFFCNAQPTGTLTIDATNFKSDKGVAIVHLFRIQDDIPKKPFQEASRVILNGQAGIVLHNLSYGDYAVIVFHDENSNGILDHRLGFPNEPMGFSNDWKLSLFSGMPTFTKLRFEFSESKARCRITIR
jgi:uncharacterized protein (DUF2141 family)